MGVRSVLGYDPVRYAREVLEDSDDKARRVLMANRRAIFEDDSETSIKNEIDRVFNDPTVKSRARQFAPLARSQSIARRIINELTRPVYMVPPVRNVDNDADQKRYQDIAAECALDERLALGLALGLAETASFVQTLYVPRLERMVCSILPADCVSVIADPDDPYLELALIYDKPVYKNGTWVTWHVYWDDEVRFQLDENGNKIPFKGGDAHQLGRIPFVSIHTAPRVGGAYWNPSHNESLFATQRAASLLTLLALRKLKARGFPAMVVNGDIRQFPKGQLLDEEVPIQAPEGTDVKDLQNEADADNYLRMLDALTMTAAANNGISRARMNQDKDGDDTGLLEQRAEMIRIMRPVELAQFEVCKAVSQEYPEQDRRLSLDAKLAVDFGELPVRVDPKAALEVWDLKRKMGIANVLDQIKAENPEIRTDEEAEAELQRNLEIESKFIEARRALNMASDANTRQPGQDPAANGAMGPMVRDGQMTKDEAAQHAENGLPDLEDDDVID